MTGNGLVPPARRVLVLTATTGYQTRSFGDAAERLGVELVMATDRCHVLDDPWRDSAIPVRFHAPQESADAIVRSLRERPPSGVLTLGDRPAVIAALAAWQLGLAGHPPASALASANKLQTRERFAAAGLNAPWFTSVRLDHDPRTMAGSLRYPCVVKPLGMSGSRGVIRADDPGQFVEAFARLVRMLRGADIRALRDPINDVVMIEGFIEGTEFAVEGLLDAGGFRMLALFDKPDPLDGPFFEETIYLTPTSATADRQGGIGRAVGAAIEALGLRHGPVHAECRVKGDEVWVLEVAPRPIGGLCARALRFVDRQGTLISFEELLLRHALGESIDGWVREPGPSGVMMVPIPRAGVYRRVEGVDDASAVDLVTEIRVTAKEDQRLVPLPEGASYLGFIFARGADGETPERVSLALREAHRRLHFVIDPVLTVLP